MAQLRDVSHVFYGVAYKVNPSLSVVKYFSDNATQLEEAIRNRIGAQSQDLDVNGWMARTTLEMLGQAGLGYSFDKFTEDSTDSYGEALKSFLYVLCFPFMRDKLNISTPVVLLSTTFLY